MPRSPRIKLIIVTYWFLLSYVVAALVWWFIALQQQNNKMTELRLKDLVINNADYGANKAQIEKDKRRKTAQYIGEGATFFILILVGAVFVYRATRRQLRMGQQQQNFMMAVTHELKTPIAVARLNIETLQKRKLEEAQQQKLFGTTLQEMNRLNNLCNNILLASQLDGGRYESAKTEVDMSKLAQNVVNDFAQRYPRRSIIATIAEGIIIVGEELLLELLLSNLIENAVKYSPPEKPVLVSLSANEQQVILKVIDQGMGIAAGEREKVFEKFYRIGNEATRTAKGTGLGLYLCRQIARQHKATISIEDNGRSGSVFVVKFG